MKLGFNYFLLHKWLFFFITFIFQLNHLVFAQNINRDQEKLVCQSNLSHEIDKIIKHSSTDKATWGIVVKKLNSPNNIYSLNGDQYFIPASNVKLFTTSAILLKLGTNFQIKTPVYLEKNLDNKYNLTIVGKGDPTITNRDLDFLAKKLQENRIKQINQLTVIDGYLPQPVINESWEYSDIYYYYAVPVNSLILNENTVTLNLLPSGINQPVKLDWDDEIASKQWFIQNEAITANKDTEYNINITPIFTTSILKITGELPFNSDADEWMLAIPQPDLYFLESLKQILNSNDILVNKTQVINEKQTNNQQVNNNLFFEFISPNLTELITITNQESNNLYAEVLLKYLAVDNQDLNQFVSIEEILTKLGLDKNSYELKDGSGLSRQNLITPLALVQLLELMANSKYDDIFFNSLAIAGKAGTLKNRFQDTVIVDQFYGKTGTLSGVSALSGYLKRENQDTLVMSIIINNSTEKSSTLRKIIDEIVLLFSTINFNCNN